MELEEFIEKYQKGLAPAHAKDPKIIVKMKQTGNETFAITYAGGQVALEAENPRGAIHGLSVLKTALGSGHIVESLGQHHPRCPLRVLWIMRALSKTVLEDREAQESLCQKILLLGYNTVILGLSDLESSEFLATLQTFNAYKIQVAIRFQQNEACFLDPSFVESLQPILSWVEKHSEFIDFIFWDATVEEQYVQRHPKARELLRQDLALREIDTLEKQLEGRCGLIYSIPTRDVFMAEKQSRWILPLCHEISDQTFIAFSATAGDPCSDWLAPHPLWGKLRATTMETHLNLLPLINAGLVKQGEGLWPTTSLDLINRYLLRCDRKTFSGAIALVGSVPQEDALLSCSLWIASRTLWGERSPNLLVESWFRAFRPEWLRVENLECFLCEVREIAMAVDSLSTTRGRTKDQTRILADCLLSRLCCLQASMINEQSLIESKPGFADYLPFFIRDARRLLVHSLQRLKVPIPGAMQEGDSLESFWSEGSQSDIIILDAPKRGENALMAHIYEEVFGN